MRELIKTYQLNIIVKVLCLYSFFYNVLCLYSIALLKVNWINFSFHPPSLCNLKTKQMKKKYPEFFFFFFFFFSSPYAQTYTRETLSFPFYYPFFTLVISFLFHLPTTTKHRVGIKNNISLFSLKFPVTNPEHNPTVNNTINYDSCKK